MQDRIFGSGPTKGTCLAIKFDGTPDFAKFKTFERLIKTKEISTVQGEAGEISCVKVKPLPGFNINFPDTKNDLREIYDGLLSAYGSIKQIPSQQEKALKEAEKTLVDMMESSEIQKEIENAIKSPETQKEIEKTLTSNQTQKQLEKMLASSEVKKQMQEIQNSPETAKQIENALRSPETTKQIEEALNSPEIKKTISEAEVALVGYKNQLPTIYTMLKIDTNTLMELDGNLSGLLQFIEFYQSFGDNLDETNQKLLRKLGSLSEKEATQVASAIGQYLLLAGVDQETIQALSNPATLNAINDFIHQLIPAASIGKGLEELVKGIKAKNQELNKFFQKATEHNSLVNKLGSLSGSDVKTVQETINNYISSISKQPLDSKTLTQIKELKQMAYDINNTLKEFKLSKKYYVSAESVGDGIIAEVVPQIIRDLKEQILNEYKKSVVEAFQKSIFDEFKKAITQAFKNSITDAYKEALKESYEKTISETLKRNIILAYENTLILLAHALQHVLIGGDEIKQLGTKEEPFDFDKLTETQKKTRERWLEAAKKALASTDESKETQEIIKRLTTSKNNI
jgi:hypothetical protein